MATKETPKKVVKKEVLQQEATPEFEPKPHIPETINAVEKDYYITEEQRTRLVSQYPHLVQNDFDRKDGEYPKDVFLRIAASIGMTEDGLTGVLWK